VLFHHDPMHSDEYLDRFFGVAVEQWTAAGGDPTALELATERRELELPAPAPAPAAASPTP
jgi:hypothetical protein